MNAVHTLSADDFALREFFVVCAQIERRLRSPQQVVPAERTIARQRTTKPTPAKRKQTKRAKKVARG